MKTINEFTKINAQKKPITMVTCYDYWSALIISDTEIDAVLVGDSLGMIETGFETTVNTSVQMIAYHTAAVNKGLTNKLLIADIPFLAHRKGQVALVEASEKIVQAGATAVKIEGGNGNYKNIDFLVNSGIPVMGHLGLTPQSVHKFGGFNLQGKDESSKTKIIEEAKKLQDAGVFGIVLEMIPANLAEEITNLLDIPTIGIGAGNKTCGQILVLHDLLGLNKSFSPKFVRKYTDGFELFKNSVNNYCRDVVNSNFPSKKETHF